MKGWGIRAKLLFLALIPTTITCVLLGIYFISERIQDLEEGLTAKGEVLAQQLAPASEYGVFSGNREILQSLVNAAMTDADVRSVSIFDADGRLLVRSGPEMLAHVPPQVYPPFNHLSAFSDDGRTLNFYVPILVGDVAVSDLPDAGLAATAADFGDDPTKLLGLVAVEMSRASTLLKKYQAIISGTTILLVGLLVSALVALQIARNIANPILVLYDTVARLKGGDFSSRAQVRAEGELSALASGINAMAASLQTAHEEMQESVEQATADLRQTLETIEIQNIELDLARKRALEASRIKSEFLANMSHEIRTPMSGVLGYTELLLKTRLNPAQFEYVSTIHKSAGHLLNVINDILDFSQLEANKLSLEHSEVGLQETVEDVLAMLAPVAQEKDLDLVALVYADVPGTVETDAFRLKQVLGNLVSNAIKFTDQGEVAVRVMLEGRTGDEVVLRITITDSGIGLSREQQRFLFRAFAQADTSPRRRYGGSGLGLVICKKLVEQMGGQIGVDSEEGTGSTFWFTVRCRVLEDAHGTLPPGVLRGTRALLCEPHALVRTALHHMLTGWDIEVTECQAQAEIAPLLDQALAEDRPVAAVLIGTRAADACARDLLQLLRRLRRAYGIPIVVLPNAANLPCIEELHSAGARFTLAKPVVQARLHKALLDCITASEPVASSAPPQRRQAAPVDPDALLALVVDDNPANLKLAAIMLEELGLQVHRATSGREAVTLAAQQHYDLILMDMQMPEMDGEQSTREIREMEHGIRHTPIIAVTAHAMEGERARVLAAGLDDYLSKPFRQQQLLELIQRWARGRAGTPAARAPTAVAEGGSAPESPAVDQALALQLVNGNADLATYMLNALADELPEQLVRMEQAYAAGDWAELRELVHKLHGTSCYAGTPALKEAFAGLETLLTATEIARPTLEPSYRHLQQMAAELLTAVGRTPGPAAP